MEREQRRRQRELERQRKEAEWLTELARAELEVAEYENYIELLQTLHKECSESVDWEKIEADPPAKPVSSSQFAELAEAELKNYKPSFFDRILRRTEKKVHQLEKQILEASEKDREAFTLAEQGYKEKILEWKLAKGVLKKEKSKMQSAFKLFPSAFSELEGLGSRVELSVLSRDSVQVNLYVRTSDIVPKEKKSLLKSGKLSTRPLPLSIRNQVYQDYVCSASLRVVREVLAIVPVAAVLLTVYCKLLNTKTGHLEDQPILSSLLPRQTMETLNFEMLDPSDAFENFTHQVNFKKLGGFSPITPIKI
ncbi:MAG: hypothetical protein KIT46_11310 [Anaerolineales bacterium]|nr:hypothetical protein [Anaerolineales bacterium]MCW5856619.1 hypothetical protein [Anaerolineales bacterium]